MFIQINPDQYINFQQQIDAMFALRYRVFHERLNWVEGQEDQIEYDCFDEANPIYLVKQEDDGTITACVRLLPSTGPNMLRDTFPFLLDDSPVPASPRIWESSRFAVDTQALRAYGADRLQSATSCLFLAMVEAGIALNLDHIMTVTDLRVERIIRSAGWPSRRIGAPQTVGNTKAVALYLETSEQAWQSISTKAGIGHPVLFQPVFRRQSVIAA